MLNTNTANTMMYDQAVPLAYPIFALLCPTRKDSRLSPFFTHPTSLSSTLSPPLILFFRLFLDSPFLTVFSSLSISLVLFPGHSFLNCSQSNPSLPLRLHPAREPSPRASHRPALTFIFIASPSSLPPLFFFSLHVEEETESLVL